MIHVHFFEFWTIWHSDMAFLLSELQHYLNDIILCLL
jgi:hypothetical protein